VVPKELNIYDVSRIKRNTMRLTKRDWGAFAIIVIVLAALSFSTLRERPKKVPADSTHLPFLQAIGMGLERETVEKECLNCHNKVNLPLPSGHPPKEQCLLCHAGLS
jgi:hypothetical protein